MQLHSPLSAVARPFQPGATSSSALVDDTPQDYPAWDGLTRSSPPRGSTRGLLVREATPSHHYTSDEDGASTDTSMLDRPLAGGMEAEEVKVPGVVATSMKLVHPEGGKRKRMGFLVRSESPNSGVRRVILMMWLTPLGSGPIALLITMTIMRIPTSCP